MALVDMRTIGGRLAFARGEKRSADTHRRGVSQGQLAEAISVHRVTVSDWERDPLSDIGGKHLVAICAYLNLEPNWLLTGQGPMRPSPTTGKSFQEVFDERLGAMRSALGLLFPAGNESVRALEEFAYLAGVLSSIGGAMFFLGETYQQTNRAGYVSMVEAIQSSYALNHTDSALSGYLVERFREIANLFDETGGLWQEWENGELSLAVDDQETAGMDDILKLPAPEKYQVVPRFVPVDPGADPFGRRG